MTDWRWHLEVAKKEAEQLELDHEGRAAHPEVVTAHALVAIAELLSNILAGIEFAIEHGPASAAKWGGPHESLEHD